jgi:invasion protein IalB
MTIRIACDGIGARAAIETERSHLASRRGEEPRSSARACSQAWTIACRLQARLRVRARRFAIPDEGEVARQREVEGKPEGGFCSS